MLGATKVVVSTRRRFCLQIDNEFLRATIWRIIVFFVCRFSKPFDFFLIQAIISVIEKRFDLLMLFVN